MKKALLAIVGIVWCLLVVAFGVAWVSGNKDLALIIGVMVIVPVLLLAAALSNMSDVGDGGGDWDFGGGDDGD